MYIVGTVDKNNNNSTIILKNTVKCNMLVKWLVGSVCL